MRAGSFWKRRQVDRAAGWFAVMTVMTLLAACGNGGGEPDDTALNPIPDQPVLARGCDWALIFDPAQPGLGNTAFPDTGARYWGAVLAGNLPEGSRLRIQGQFPDARYSALHVHNGALTALDALADYELTPDDGSRALFLDQTRINPETAFGGRYTAFLLVDVERPPVRARNTLYRTPPAVTDGTVRRRTALIYRTYLPEGGNQGRVGLPQLTLETSEGSGRLPRETESTDCAEIAAALRQDGVRLAVATNVIDPAPALPNPAFKPFRGAFGVDGVGTGVGYNEQNGFLFTKTDDNYGQMLLVRGRAPSHTSQTGAPPRPQVRYWSICHSSFASQRVHDCVSDREIELDNEAYYTVVMTPDATRPAILNVARGFAWVQLAPDQIGAATMRELLASPGYTESTVSLPPLTTAAAHKGEYMPLATYCSNAVFASAAAMGPRVAFEVCDASRRPLAGAAP